MLHYKTYTIFLLVSYLSLFRGWWTYLRPIIPSRCFGLSLFLFILFCADPALAVQAHGPPEGYYAHLMAHVFLSVSLVFLLYFLRVRSVGSGPAWRYFKLSLLFFLIWNFWTFTAHWLSHQLPPGVVSTSGSIWTHRFTPEMTFKLWVYYFSRFDHFLCLPAIWFLLKSLKTFCVQIEKERSDQGEIHE